MQTLQLIRPDLTGLAPEIAALYSPDETVGYRLKIDDEPAVVDALKKERQFRKEAETMAKNLERDSSLETNALRRQLAQLESERDSAKRIADTMRRTALETAVREKARTAGLHDAAVPDALRAAREMFDLDAEGGVIPRDGKASTTLDNFFAAARQTSPHWFPATGSGAGIGQASGRAGGGVTMNRAMFEATSPGQRAALLREGVRLTD
jgi:hypothetical protein